MTAVLSGVRVLDFGRFIAGPYCAALLGDMGADVIRVERLEGGEDRYVSPVAPTGEGGTFLQLNRNKRSLALNLTSEAGADILRRLVSTADVVVANLPPKTMRRLGLDYESLCRMKPDVILAWVSAYGSAGPYSDQVGFDGVGAMMSGAGYMAGTPERPSVWSVPYVDFSTALGTAYGVVCALMHKAATGEGQCVESSLLTTALTVSNSMLIEQAVAAPDRQPTGGRAHQIGPGDLFRCRDGNWILVQVIGNAQFRRWATLMGEEERWTGDPKFADDGGRGRHGQELSDRMQLWCDGQTRPTALAALSEARIAASPVYKPQDTLEDPHVMGAGLFVPMSFEGLSVPVPVAGPISRLSASAASYRTSAPRLGGQTAEVLSELGYDASQIAGLHRSREVFCAESDDETNYHTSRY